MSHRSLLALSFLLSSLTACHDHEHGEGDDHDHEHSDSHAHDDGHEASSDLSVGCEHFEFGPFVGVEPNADGGAETPTLDAPHTLYELSGPGVVHLAMPKGGRYLLLLSSDVSLELARAEVQAEPTDVAECAAAAVGLYVMLEAGRVHGVELGGAVSLVLHGPIGAAHDHGAHDHTDVPAPYAGAENPLAGDAEAGAAGAELWGMHCADCHGEGGGGDGPDAADLDPAPTDFTAPGALASMPDDYLLWRISEGGEEPSEMPAWADTLDETAIWQVVTHLRTLTP